MKIGCCISMDHYDQLVQAGYRSIALAAKDVAAWDDKTLRAVRCKLENGPLEHHGLNSFCTPALRLHGDGYSPEALASYMRRVCQRAERLGMKYIGVGAPGSRNLRRGEDRETATDQFREATRLMCKIAADYGADVLLESVCSLECNFLTTTREALAFLRTVQEKNLHLVYDVYHEAMERQPVDVIDEAASEIRTVHIAQDQNGRRAYLNAAHIETYRQYWDALQRVGYAGEWNLEAFIGDPAVELKKTMQIMNAVKREEQ